MWVQWYSPTSAKWSKFHRSTQDWLDSDPKQRITVCGRRPPDVTRFKPVTVSVSNNGYCCKHCSGMYV